MREHWNWAMKQTFMSVERSMEVSLIKFVYTSNNYIPVYRCWIIMNVHVRQMLIIMYTCKCTGIHNYYHLVNMHVHYVQLKWQTASMHQRTS